VADYNPSHLHLSPQ